MKMLKDILNKNVIETDVECKNWRECVNKVGELLIKEGKVTPVFVKTMEETVERYGPYMILVPEVAFFHGMPSENVSEICLSLITLKHSVYFNDFDNQEIKCAFGFGAVDSDSHIKILQQVAGLLSDKEFIDLITHNGSKEDILNKIKEF